MLTDTLKPFEAECENCGFSCFLSHNLNEEDYIIQLCPICGSEEFFTDNE